MTDSNPARSKMVHFCTEAFNRNLLPGLVLQAFAVAIVAAYYCWPEAKWFYQAISDMKTKGGYAFSAVSTCIFGGLIPFAFMVVSKRISGDLIRQGLFLSLFWIWRGVEVDAFYRFQAVIFGHGADWQTIAMKVLVDQFIYNVVWVGPLVILLFVWKDCGFSFGKTWVNVRRDFFTFRMPTLLIPSWAFGIPAGAIVYCLPNPLQIPLFNIIICFWSLVMCLLADRTKSD